MPRYSGWAEQRGLRGCHGLHSLISNLSRQWLKAAHPTAGWIACISGDFSGINGLAEG